MSTTTTPPTQAAPVRMTAEEFAARHRGDNVELIDGVVKELPVPGLEHGKICAKMTSYLFVHAETHDLGHVMSNDSFVKVDSDRVRGADVLFSSYERLPKGQPVPVGWNAVAPDLVVEVKSPTNGWDEMFTKLGEYLRIGVRVVVFLDPVSATASVYRKEEFQQIFDNGDALTLPDVLPGFSVAVARLFG